MATNDKNALSPNNPHCFVIKAYITQQEQPMKLAMKPYLLLNETSIQANAINMAAVYCNMSFMFIIFS